jgi:glycosyltransferase 2 family protein
LKKRLLSALKFLIFLGLGILLSWLAVKGLKEEDKAQIYRSISEANYTWIALSMVVGILAHISRAVRWKMLLAPLGFNPKLSNTFHAVMIGYLANLAPLRIGEVVRCGILKRYEKIPLTQSFGTVIAERVIDLFVLFLLLIITVWREYQRMHVFISENIIDPIKLKAHTISENKIMLFLLMGSLLAIAMVFFIFRKKILKNRVVQKVFGLILAFWEGILTVRNVKNPFLFVFHSLFIWAMYLLSVYICVFAFEETKSMTLGDCLVMMAVGSLGVIATPGGIGAYQWIVLQLMLFWGYTTAMGVAFGWVVWIAQTALVILVGLLSFGLLAIGNKEEGLEV